MMRRVKTKRVNTQLMNKLQKLHQNANTGINETQNRGSHSHNANRQIKALTIITQLP